MSYPRGTILKRDEPLDEIEVEVGMDDDEQLVTTKLANPLNDLEIVGPSPVSTSSVAEWNGVGGDALIVKPHKVFGANQVAPLAALQKDYSVVKMGDPDEVRREVTITPAERQRKLLSPEDVFSQASKEPAKRGPGRPKASA